MPKTKEQHAAEISGALQNSTINSLIAALAEANAKIEELTEKLEAVKPKKKE